MKLAAVALMIALLLSSCTYDEELRELIDAAEQSALEKQMSDFDIKTDYVPYEIEYDTEFGLPYYAGEKLHPVYAESEMNAEIAKLTHEALFRLSDRGFPEKELCSSYTRNGDIYTFKIRDGHYFSRTERRVTAFDAAYSINLAGLPEIEYCKAIDTETLEIKSSYGALPAILDIAVIPDGCSSVLPDGSGAYKLVEKDGLYTLESDSANIKSVRLYAAESADELLREFEAGNVDMTAAYPLDTSSITVHGSTEKYACETRTIQYLIINTERITDRQVRTSLSELIDRDKICSEIFENRASAAYIPVPGYSYLYSDKYEKPYSALGAYSEALPRKLEILVSSGNQYRLKACGYIAGMWTAAGTETAVKEVKWNDFREMLETGDFDVAYAQRTLPKDFSCNSLIEYTEYEDLDELFKTYEMSDFEERFELSKAIYERINEDKPIIPLCFNKRVVLTHTGRLKNVTVSPESLYGGIKEIALIDGFQQK